MTTTSTFDENVKDVPSTFPCILTMDFPLPDHRLASTAQRAIQVDAELSPLVRRSLTLVSESMGTAESSLSSTLSAAASPSTTTHENQVERKELVEGEDDEAKKFNVLRVEYRATTNRMLRVAVNGFMESFALVLHVMQDLDVDVLDNEPPTNQSARSTSSAVDESVSA